MHDRLRSARIQNHLASGQIINIANKMLSVLNKDLVEHNKRTAYIAFLIFQNYKMPEKCTLSNLVFLALYHTIGFFRTDYLYNVEDFDFSKLFSDENFIKDKYVYGSYYLEYMTHLEEDARALKYFHRDFISGESDVSYILSYKEVIYFSARMAFYFAQNKDAEFPRDLNELAPNKFNPEIVSAFEKINKDNFVWNKLKTGEYELYIANIINTFHFSKEINQKIQKILVYFLDFKSTATFKHAINTACFALSLGYRVSLTEKELQVLFTSAILHDVGKIAIPEKILESPKKFTPEEFEIMKKHVEYSKEIIQDYVSQEVVDAVYRHHEKLDGSGYPDHLTAKDLTPIQKIITVADILSALLDSRSYKHEYSQEKTFKILSTMCFDGEIDPFVTEFIITDFNEILNELASLQEDFKANYNSVISKINDYVFRHYHDKNADSNLETLESIDDIEDLEELEELEIVEE